IAASDAAAAAAASALKAMDNGGVPLEDLSSAGGLSSPAAAPEAAAPAASQGGKAPGESPVSPGAKPAWVDNPVAVYPRQRYVAAVGFGGSRQEAERSALGNLVSVFGQSVQAELKTVSSYSEAVRSGAIQVTEDNSIHDAVTTSAWMDTLVGAEIAETWHDGKSSYYAAAVMEKQKTAVLYGDFISSNQRIIEDLINVKDEDKNTLSGYSRCLLAATIADVNRVYANVLTYVGNTTSIKPSEMKKGDEYRLEAAEIARNIPINVSVRNDRSDRVKNAFSRALSSLGFRSGGSSSRYTLEGRLVLEKAELPNQRNVFVRYYVDAELKDNAESGAVLLPYNVNGREGHLNQSEAEERALRAAEKNIENSFGALLQDYLSTLLPSR
ncbi:MAG: LPP20 family lipoprotein, partial [Treponema sp.]|nr:LPP20 family lipoprotein [Treponema sp.]